MLKYHLTHYVGYSIHLYLFCLSNSIRTKPASLVPLVLSILFYSVLFLCSGLLYSVPYFCVSLYTIHAYNISVHVNIIFDLTRIPTS